MATRCRIGVQTENSIRHVYCHWDGYPEHILPIITKWDRKEFERLIEKGDLSFCIILLLKRRNKMNSTGILKRKKFLKSIHFGE